MSERLERLAESALDPEQLGLYRQIREGPRAAVRSFALTDRSGSLNGPFGLMLRVPKLGQPLQDLGAALRFRTSLGDRERELLTLRAAVVLESEFEWYAHERAGRESGLSEDELHALKAGSYVPRDPAEAHLVGLADILLAHGEVDDATYADLAEALSVQQVLEVIILVGYYRTLAQMMRVFAIGSPTED
jgi:4-carboxymuconolactone decarboxylase